MQLFTPVSPEVAASLERGAPLDCSLFWLDRPVPEEVDEDAIWVEIDLPEDEVAEYETRSARELGYREFELPPTMPARSRARRAAVAPDGMR